MVQEVEEGVGQHSPLQECDPQRTVSPEEVKSSVRTKGRASGYA